LPQRALCKKEWSYFNTVAQYVAEFATPLSLLLCEQQIGSSDGTVVWTSRVLAAVCRGRYQQTAA
jgi:hypothetical protein